VGVKRYRTMGAPLLETPVEGAKAGGADDGVGAGTARAAEVAGAAQRIAAMQAPPCHRDRRRGNSAEGEVAHLRNIRLVSAKRRPCASTTMSRSQLPREGRSTWPTKWPSPRSPNATGSGGRFWAGRTNSPDTRAVASGLPSAPET